MSIPRPPVVRDRPQLARRPLLFALTYVVLAVGFLYDAVLSGGSYLLRDILTFFHPWQTAVRESLQAGQLPLWNHDTFCGIPLAANLQSGVFYPPNWLYAVLPFDTALTMGMVLHLALAGMLMHVFLRRLALNQSSAFLGGVLFAFGSWSLSYLEFPMKLGSAIWLPLLWTGIWDAMASGRRRGLGWGALAVGLSLLAGYPQMTFLGLLSAGLLALLLAIQTLRDGDLSRMDRLHRLGALPVIVLLGAGIAGIQLLPAAEMTELSSKTVAYDPAVAMTRSLPAKGLLGMIDPFLFGFPGVARFWGGEIMEYCFGAFYVGGLGLILVLGSAPAFLRFQRRRRVRREDLVTPVETAIVPRVIPFFLLGGLALGILLSLGRNTPVYGWLHEFLPGFGRTRWPATAGFLIAVHLAALAAVGVQAIRRDYRRIHIASWCAIGWGALTLAGWLLVRGPLAGAARSFLLDGAPAYQQGAWDAASADWHGTLWLRALIPIVAGGLGLALAPIRSRVPVAWALLLTLDLFLMGRSLGFPVERGFYDAPNARAEAVKEQLGDHRIFTPRSVDQLGNFLSGSDNVTAFEWAKRAMLCNANIPAGVPQAHGCEPLNPRRHEAFVQIFEDPATSHEIKERLFDLWDAAALVEMTGVRPLMVPAIQDPDVGLRFNPHEPRIGRATLATGWETLGDGPAVLNALLAPTHDPRGRTLIEIPEGAVPPAESRRTPTRRAEPVEYELGPNSISAAWHVGDGGMFRILESWAPGWQATANGNPVPVYRADFLFMAVPVPEGSVQLEVTYRPDSFRNGAIASLVGLIALAFCFASRRGRRTHVADAAPRPAAPTPRLDP